MRHLKKPLSNENAGTRTNEGKKSWRQQKCKNKKMEIIKTNLPITNEIGTGLKVIIRQYEIGLN